jgi:hypothetical protein
MLAAKIASAFGLEIVDGMLAAKVASVVWIVDGMLAAAKVACTDWIVDGM